MPPLWNTNESSKIRNKKPYQEGWRAQALNYSLIQQILINAYYVAKNFPIWKMFNGGDKTT